MKGRVSGNDRAAVRPVAVACHQFSADRAGQRVEAESGERVTPPFLFTQDVVVRLVLPFLTVTERGLQVRAQRFRGVELIRLPPRTHPDEMQMLARRGVQGVDRTGSRPKGSSNPAPFS
jgi:hypothetical protein